METKSEQTNRKKEAVKAILRKLHQGMPVEAAKQELEAQAGSLSSAEIAEIEQSLINEGVSPDEIKRFCNVHALMFESALRQGMDREESPTHPVHLFKLENRKIEEITAALRRVVETRAKRHLPELKTAVAAALKQLGGLEIHYTRKEQLLFPFLERHGFFGPSKVMWGKHNDVREMLKRAATQLEAVADSQGMDEYASSIVLPLAEEIDGMVFKEENILFPTAMEKLSVQEWVEVLKDSDEVGYVFIEKPMETSQLIREFKRAAPAEITLADGGRLSFPTGDLDLRELLHMLNALPVDITFVDKDDTVRYFSDNKSRVFVRTSAVIGRKVQHCHPPQSVHIVEEILAAFRDGRRDQAEFHINFRGRFIHIRYLAIRGPDRTYLGTLEVTQDITELRQLAGEKRLLDEKH